MSDDRAQFLADRAASIGRMAQDDSLFSAAMELTDRADEYRFSYAWDWLGVPIIQMPTDIVVVQELLWRCRPQLVIECGVARGGSVILYASILELLGEGRVLGIDVDIRAHNRDAIESHPLHHRIDLLEGSSVAVDVVDAVRARASECERVMVVLDSDHTHEHVLAELRAYGSLVTVGQFLVVADTFIEEVRERPERDRPWGHGDNPMTAVRAYLKETDRFEMDELVNGKLLMSSSRFGYLRATS